MGHYIYIYIMYLAGPANLSLVVWGTNLTSTVGIGRSTEQVKDMIKLPLHQYSIIVGLLLSEGWLAIPTKTSKNARLGFEQSYSRFEYVWFVFNALSHYCSSLPTVKSKRGISLASLAFVTRSLPCFTELPCDSRPPLIYIKIKKWYIYIIYYI